MAKDDIIRTFAGTGVWPSLQIIIQEASEAGWDKKLNVSDEDTIINIPVEKVFLLKGAMSSGQPSVTIYAKAKDGLHIGLEISPNLLKSVANMVIAAGGTKA